MKYAHPPMNPTPKPHDPRLAPLAAALRQVFPTGSPWHYAEWAAAILAELPPDWCGHADALDNAYRERNAVVAALIRTNGWKASLVPAPDADGWWVVYAETPQGQVSWHIHPTDIRLFDGVPAEYVAWDGHSTDEKYERVADLGRNIEIARLRAIEEAARAVIVARDAWLACDDDWEDDCGHNHDVAFDALRAALGEKP